MSRIVVAHETETIREVTRRLLSDQGWRVDAVGEGSAVERAVFEPPAPAGLVVDVALGNPLAYQLIDEVRRRQLPTKVVLIASIYNRTGYKRRPTSLYGADDYVEQHHIPDALPEKLARLVGPPPRPVPAPVAHAVTPEGEAIRAAGQSRLAPIPTAADAAPRDQRHERALRLARLIVADVALYNGDALDRAARAERGALEELDARLRLDLEEGRLLFDLRVPEDVRRERDWIAEALEALLAERRGAVGAPPAGAPR